MNRLIFTCISISISVLQPLKAFELSPSIELIGNSDSFVSEVLSKDGVFDFKGTKKFVFEIKHELNRYHGIKLDLNSVVDAAMKTLVESGSFSDKELSSARELYTTLITSDVTAVKSCFFGGKNDKKSSASELILPDKMAIGFVCVFSGALLCILPFGFTQGIGAGLIGTGIYSVMEGTRDGEKPYYVDTKSGSITNCENASGIGINF